MEISTATIHGQAYEFYHWPALGRDIFELARQIHSSNQKFDRVVALAKGGLTFARSLTDYLEIPEVSTFQVEFYTGIGQTNKTPVITQSLPVRVKGERVLLFDDVADKGDTMQLATEYLRYHGVEHLTTCTLVLKPWSHFTPDFAVHKTEAWVIFPNEIRETIELLTKTWQKLGDSAEQIHKQLLEIGFSKPEVEFFAQIK